MAEVDGLKLPKLLFHLVEHSNEWDPVYTDRWILKDLDRGYYHDIHAVIDEIAGRINMKNYKSFEEARDTFNKKRQEVDDELGDLSFSIQYRYTDLSVFMGNFKEMKPFNGELEGFNAIEPILSIEPKEQCMFWGNKIDEKALTDRDPQVREACQILQKELLEWTAPTKDLTEQNLVPRQGFDIDLSKFEIVCPMDAFNIDYKEKFGIELGQDDWVNVYAHYNPQTAQASFDVYIDTPDGENELGYMPTEQENLLVQSIMEEKILEETGKTPLELMNEYLDKDNEVAR